MRDIYITLMGPCYWAGLGGCLAIRVGLGRFLTFVRPKVIHVCSFVSELSL